MGFWFNKFWNQFPHCKYFSTWIEYGTYSKSIQTELHFLKQISDAYRSILFFSLHARLKRPVSGFFCAFKTLDEKSRVWYDGGEVSFPPLG